MITFSSCWEKVIRGAGLTAPIHLHKDNAIRKQNLLNLFTGYAEAQLILKQSYVKPLTPQSLPPSFFPTALQLFHMTRAHKHPQTRTLKPSAGNLYLTKHVPSPYPQTNHNRSNTYSRTTLSLTLTEQTRTLVLPSPYPQAIPSSRPFPPLPRPQPISKHKLKLKTRTLALPSKYPLPMLVRTFRSNHHRREKISQKSPGPLLHIRTTFIIFVSTSETHSLKPHNLNLQLCAGY